MGHFSAQSQLLGCAVAVVVLHQLGAGAAQGWITGRATFYGGPPVLGATYDTVRGEGSFGILAEGSCGFTEKPEGHLPFARDEVAAMADANPGYPGSCGRCYEVKCKSGLVYASADRPVAVLKGPSNISYFDGDFMRPDLASINPGFKDSFGRSFPGNPAIGDQQNYARCWDDNQVMRVRIIDSCPCRQVLPDGAPGVKPGGEVRRQEWCCGGQNHFDLSYWAFEKLAHPVYGVMSIQYRPVDCNNPGKELPLDPGYISKTIYSGRPMLEPGWGWAPYYQQYSRLAVQGLAPDGAAATCLSVSPGGGVSFKSKEAYKPGYQPLAGASSIEFEVRPNSGNSDPYASSTPQGQVPPLKVFLMKDEGGNHCGKEVSLKTLEPQKLGNDWYRFSIPLSSFDCPGGGGIPLDQIDRLDFQNVAERNAIFCLANIKIV